MTDTPIHGHDHDSTASIMGIDAPTDERAVLLEIERESTEYGLTTHNGGHPCFLVLVGLSEASPTCSCFLSWLLNFMFPSFVERKLSISQSTVAKRIKYYIPSLRWIPDYSFSLYVPINSQCAPVQINSPSIALEVTF